MFEILIGFGVLLVLIILLLLFRVNVLVAVAKGSDKKIASSSNRINAALLLAFVIIGFVGFFWYSFVNFENYTLPVASDKSLDLHQGGPGVCKMCTITVSLCLLNKG